MEHQACTSRAGRTSGRGDLLLGALEHQAQDEKSRGGMGATTGDPDRDTGSARARDEAAQAARAFASARTPGVTGKPARRCGPLRQMRRELPARVVRQTRARRPVPVPLLQLQQVLPYRKCRVPRLSDPDERARRGGARAPRSIICTPERAEALGQSARGGRADADELCRAWAALVTGCGAISRSYVLHLVDRIEVRENEIRIVARTTAAPPEEVVKESAAL